MNFVSHVTIPFEKLERLLNLPEGARIVHVQDHELGTHAIVRIWADKMPPTFVFEADDPLSKIGDAYRGLIEEPKATEAAESEPVVQESPDADEGGEEVVVPVEG